MSSGVQEWAPPIGYPVLADPDVPEFDYRTLTGLALIGPESETLAACEERLANNYQVWNTYRQVHNRQCEEKVIQRQQRLGSADEDPAWLGDSQIGLFQFNFWCLCMY
jgi:hypothetical protein